MRFRWSAATLCSCLILSMPALGADDYLSDKRHGIEFYALHPEAEEIDSIRTTDAATALRRMAEATDRLIVQSPIAADRIKALIDKGRVQIIYDARHPRDTLNSVNIAAYLPKHYVPEEGKTIFVVLFGRTGIQWDDDELAATIAHELAGHGYQDMERRLEGMRELDIECEAYLVEEQAKQDIGYDKTTNEAISFRNSMDYFHCDDFRRYTLTNELSVATEWDKLNPDVPALLKVFRTYLKDR